MYNKIVKQMPLTGDRNSWTCENVFIDELLYLSVCEDFKCKLMCEGPNQYFERFHYTTYINGGTFENVLNVSERFGFDETIPRWFGYVQYDYEFNELTDEQLKIISDNISSVKNATLIGKLYQVWRSSDIIDHIFNNIEVIHRRCIRILTNILAEKSKVTGC
jgi:hypothetical protein